MIQYSGKKLIIGNNSIELEYPILDAVRIDDFIAVLYDPDAKLKEPGQFPNLVAYDYTGKLKWTAELPTNQSMDTYYQISSTNPLQADSVCSFSCKIDPYTGKIVEKVFYK